MKTIVLISCVKDKLNKRAKAGELYISPFFKKSMAYAKSLHPDYIFILSAKHGLLSPSKRIEPYDLTLNDFNADELRVWSSNTLEQLRKLTDLNNDRFIILAGNRYRKYLLDSISNYQVPMKGLGIGQQMQYLNRNIK